MYANECIAVSYKSVRPLKIQICDNKFGRHKGLAEEKKRFETCTLDQFINNKTPSP